MAIDPFDYVMIASVCMGLYKTKHLQEEWKLKLAGGQEWKKVKYIDGNLEVWLNDKWVKEDETSCQIIEKMFIQSLIAKVLPRGHQDTHSKASIQWLKWVAHSNNIDIQHALNGGKKHLPGTKYKLDACCEATNQAFEYNVYIFHGCEVSFPVDRKPSTSTQASPCLNCMLSP